VLNSKKEKILRNELRRQGHFNWTVADMLLGPLVGPRLLDSVFLIRAVWRKPFFRWLLALWFFGTTGRAGDAVQAEREAGSEVA